MTIELGDPHNIHPADKQEVGARLTPAARALAYDEPVEYSGPLFREISTDTIRVWFDRVSSGLAARSGTPKGFEIAGADHRFVPATARIVGETVVVSNPQVPHPKYVRYGWANAP